MKQDSKLVIKLTNKQNRVQVDTNKGNRFDFRSLMTMPQNGTAAFSVRNKPVCIQTPGNKRESGYGPRQTFCDSE